MSKYGLYRTLGFLAKRARFEAFVPHRDRQGFEERYNRATGIQLVDGENGYYVHRPEVNKWGAQLRLSFTANPEEKNRVDFSEIAVEARIVEATQRNQYRVNNAKLVWWLWERGFRNGNSQDVGEIRKYIPPEFRAAFEEGLGETAVTTEELENMGREHAQVLEAHGDFGEGLEHRQLKEYVASHGIAIGLDVLEEGMKEYFFISGDRCDVVFDLGGSGMAVVEVKNGELGELMKGVYQAIKYRALMEAEKGLGAEVTVLAHLVAYKMPTSIRQYAEQFGIKCHIISRSVVQSWASYT